MQEVVSDHQPWKNEKNSLLENLIWNPLNICGSANFAGNTRNLQTHLIMSSLFDWIPHQVIYSANLPPIYCTVVLLILSEAGSRSFVSLNLELKLESRLIKLKISRSGKPGLTYVQKQANKSTEIICCWNYILDLTNGNYVTCWKFLQSPRQRWWRRIRERGWGFHQTRQPGWSMCRSAPVMRNTADIYNDKDKYKDIAPGWSMCRSAPVIRKTANKYKYKSRDIATRVVHVLIST